MKQYDLDQLMIRLITVDPLNEDIFFIKITLPDHTLKAHELSLSLPSLPNSSKHHAMQLESARCQSNRTLSSTEIL